MVSARTFAFASVLALEVLAGCSSKEQKALEQAKQQAASSGQAQQVVSVDQSGSTTTTTVQPPAQGQKLGQVFTVTTPAPVGQPKPAAHDPVVSAVAQNVAQNVTQTDPNSAPMGTYGLGPQAGSQPPAGAPAAASAPAQVPASITVSAGTTLAIRIDQRISVKDTHAGDGFSGEITQPVLGPDGSPVIPKGARVRGVVDAAHRRGHFKGRSILELRLTSLELNGRQYPIRTADLQRTKKGKGKRSTAFIGGGAGLGMLIGGVASGGVGLLVGGLAGGGAGTAAAGLTGNRDIVIPAETVVQFRLAHDLVLRQ